MTCVVADMAPPERQREGGYTAAHTVMPASGQVSGDRSALLARHHVPRPRIVEPLAGCRVALLEAGGGWGKSAAAAEAAVLLGVPSLSFALSTVARTPAALLRGLRSALRRVGLTDAAAVLDELHRSGASEADSVLDTLARVDDPLVVVFDDVHAAEPAAASLLLELATKLPPPHRIFLLGRRLPSLIAALQGAPDVHYFGAGDLAFTTSEIRRLFTVAFDHPVSHDVAAQAERATGGWAAAVLISASLLARSGAASPRAVDPVAALGPLIDDLLQPLGERDRFMLRDLVRVPIWRNDVIDAVAGTGAFRRFVESGLPFAPRGDGWWMLPDPVREVLAHSGVADVDTLRRAAFECAVAGEPAAAVAALHDSGDIDGVAEILANLPIDVASESDYGELEAWVQRLPAAAVAAHPNVLLHLARASQVAGLVAKRAELLARTERLARAADDARLLREVQGEQALDLWNVSCHEEARALAEGVLRSAGPDEVAARCRALDALGRVLARTGRHREQAVAMLTESMELAQQLGCRVWVAQAAMPLAWDVHSALGQLDEAAMRLQTAMEGLDRRSRQRAVMLTFQADFFDATGRYAGATAALDEAATIASLYRDRRITAYTAWERARQASQLGNPAEVIAQLRIVDSNRGDWFEHETGAEYLADAADILDRVGEGSLSRDYLSRAAERKEQAGHWFLMSEAAVLCRSGDAKTALQRVHELLAHPRLAPRHRWRILFLGAVAAVRAKSPQAVELAREAFAAAESIGRPALPYIVEASWADAVARVAAQGGSEVARRLASTRPELQLQMLGGFAIVSAGRPLPLPTARPSSLLKFVALCPDPPSIDEVVEALWPDDDPDAGRVRLRNALSRIREKAGDIVVRAGDRFQLGAGVEVDSRRFEQDAQAALASGDAGRARLALALYRGPLLPGDTYADWTAGARERFRRLRLSLLDLLAGEAEARNDLDEALRLLNRGLDEEPHDEDRLLHAATLLLRQGRRSAALRMRAQAALTLRELGLRLSARWEQLGL